MADVNYENIPSIIGIYEGTVASFEGIMNGTDTAKKQTFYGRLILITGDQTATDENAADRKQALWTSEDDGSNAHYLNMSDVATLKAQLAHIDGIAFPKNDGTAGYDKYDLTGGKGFIFKGSNGITVKINPATSTPIDGKPYWTIEVNGQTLKADLIGNTDNGSNTATHPDTIRGAKAYADSLYVELKGTKDAGDTTAQTIEGAKDYADKVKSDLQGTKAESDTTAQTIEGAKKYADDAVAKIVSDGNDAAADDTIKGAKKYTDEAKESLLGDANDGIEDNTILGVKNYAKLLATAGEVSIVESEGTGDIGKVYTFYQGGTAEVNKIGVINTPKELVVKSGQVVVNPTGQPAGTYIELTIQNQDAPLYINVADLVDVYTAKAGATEIQLAISDTNEISALIVEVNGSKITNGTVAKTKLASSVQTSLGKADSAYQKPSAGIPKTDLAAGVQTALDLATNSIHGVATADSKYINVTASVEEGGKQIRTIKAVTAPITSESATTDGLATVADIRAYLAARLSVKVVS